jgi:uncharacterized membrane protein
MKVSRTAFALITVLVLSGCDKISLVDRRPSVSGLGGAAGGSGNGGSGQSGTSGQGGNAGQGLPCDIQTIFVKYCASCHGAHPTGGAPRSLMTYTDLTRPDMMNSSMTEAQAAMQRIQDKASPMPPSPSSAPSASELATLQTWVDSGYPTGTCGMGGTTQAGSGGSGGSGGGGGGGGSSQSSSSGGAGGSSQAGTGGSTSGGLPCDIQTFLASTCASCHGTTPSGGAPRSLMTYSDLTKPDPSNTAMTEAQVALQRMQSTTSPMPPSPTPAATSAQITMMQNWIKSGYPYGSCGVGGSGGSGGGGGGSGVGGSGSGGTSQPGSGGSGGVADAGVPGGTLPCDVQTLLVNRCDSCHGTTPSGGAPRSLATYSDLTKPDLSNTAMTEAQTALQRMQSTTSPMPPSPASRATSAEIATMQNWINSGYPSGSCGGDAGPPPSDPLNAPPTCTSKTTWTQGTNGSSLMEPGQACISCHASTGGEAPKFVIAGTLYPTGHEPDNCNGVNGSAGAKVVVTGSNGTTVTLTPNSVGNFSYSTTLPPPYQAKVVSSTGLERVMSGTASTGDCNSCHTQSGANNAPGRITLP